MSEAPTSAHFTSENADLSETGYEQAYAGTANLTRTLRAVLTGKCVEGWLYGSTLRIDRTRNSDLDVLAVVDDDTSFEQMASLTRTIRSLSGPIDAPGWHVDVTMLTVSEVIEGCHPGWSRHYFTNVAATGELLWGTGHIVGGTRRTPTYDTALVRISQLTQRARLVRLNPAKAHEAPFWAVKYRHWVPLCLMEISEAGGTPIRELHRARTRFAELHPDAPALDATDDFDQIAEQLEALTRWMRVHPERLGGGYP
jgi:predicted nucleotidyltransferase